MLERGVSPKRVDHNREPATFQGDQYEARIRMKASFRVVRKVNASACVGPYESYSLHLRNHHLSRYLGLACDMKAGPEPLCRRDVRLLSSRR